MNWMQRMQRRERLKDVYEASKEDDWLDCLNTGIVVASVALGSLLLVQQVEMSLNPL